MEKLQDDDWLNQFFISDVLDIEQFSTVKGVNLDAKDDTFYQVNWALLWSLNIIAKYLD